MHCLQYRVQKYVTLCIKMGFPHTCHTHTFTADTDLSKYLQIWIYGG